MPMMKNIVEKITSGIIEAFRMAGFGKFLNYWRRLSFCNAFLL
jgi:hypothetical protein